MSNMFCSFPDEPGFSSKLLTYPPNRSLPIGRQWSHIIGLFGLDESKESYSTIALTNVVGVVTQDTVVRKPAINVEYEAGQLLHYSALALQGLSSYVFRLDVGLPNLRQPLCVQKVLLEVRMCFLQRLLISSALEYFLKSEDPVLTALGSAATRLLELIDYSLSSASLRTVAVSKSKNSLLKFWNNCRNEVLSLQLIYDTIAPDELKQASVDASFSSFVSQSSNADLDKYFCPEGWNQSSSWSYKWSLFNSLVGKFSTSCKTLWTSSNARLPELSIFINTSDYRPSATTDRTNENYVKMTTWGHSLKSVSMPLLDPLVQHLFLLQLDSTGEVQEAESMISLSVDGIWGKNQCVEDLVTNVLAWSRLRIRALVQLPSADVRRMVSRFKEMNCSLCLSTCESELLQMRNIMSYSLEMRLFFGARVETLLREWVEESPMFVKVEKPVEETKVKPVVQPRNEIERVIEITPSVDPLVSDPPVKHADESQYFPLIVGQPLVDPAALEQAKEELRRAYSAKFLKADTQKALSVWRTSRLKGLKQARIALTELLESDKDEYLALAQLKLANPTTYFETLRQSIISANVETVLETASNAIVMENVRTSDSTSEETVEEIKTDDEVEIACETLSDANEKKSAETVHSVEEVIPVIIPQPSEVVEMESDVVVRKLPSDNHISVPVEIKSDDIVKDLVVRLEASTNVRVEEVPEVKVATSVVKLAPCHVFEEVSAGILAPDLNWMNSEEELRKRMENFPKSMQALAIHSGLVEEETGFPSRQSLYGPALCSQQSLLYRCVKAQCSSINSAALYCAITQSGILVHLSNLENYCMLSPQSDFLSRLCSHMTDSCMAKSRLAGKRSMWNNEQLQLSLAHCVNDATLGLQFKLSEDLNISISSSLAPSSHWLCAGEGVTSVQVRYTAQFPISAVISVSVMDCISCMTSRCLELCQLSELLRLMWLKMKSQRQRSGKETGGESRSGLLLIQHIVRGLLAYFSERIIVCRNVFRRSLVELTIESYGLDCLVNAVSRYSLDIATSALLSPTDSSLITCTDDLSGILGSFSLLLSSCRLALGYLLNDELSSFQRCSRDVKIHLATLIESGSVYTSTQQHLHLSALLLFLKH